MLPKVATWRNWERVMSYNDAVSNYRRKYGESYPGEAAEWAADALNEAFDAKVDARVTDMASEFANRPLSILEGTPDFDCATVEVLVRHILALREFVPADALRKSVAAFKSELSDAQQIKDWAKDDVVRGDA